VLRLVHEGGDLAKNQRVEVDALDEVHHEGPDPN